MSDERALEGEAMLERLKASRSAIEGKPRASREYLGRCVEQMTVELYAGGREGAVRAPDLVAWSNFGRLWAERFADYDQLLALEALAATAGAFGGLPPDRPNLALWLFSALDGIGARFRMHGEPARVDGRTDQGELHRLWYGGPIGEEIPARAVQAWIAGALSAWRAVKGQG